MRLKLLSLVIAAVLSFLFFRTIPSLQSLIDKPESDIPLSIGIKDDPQARAEYEFEMLRDPVTNKIPRNIRKKELEFAKNLPQIADKLLLKDGRQNNVHALTRTERGPNNLGGRIRAFGIYKYIPLMGIIM